MKVIVFLAEGFEEVEALTVVDYLRRLDDVEVEMVSIGDSEYVKGAHEIIVKSDSKLDDLSNYEDYSALVIPGGMPGAINLRSDEKVIELVREFNLQGKIVAAICAGPIVLEEAKIIDSRRITSYPGFELEFRNSIYLEESVVVDENIITSRGPAFAVDFAMEIANKLVGIDRVRELKRDILYLE